jgi:branched-chain amino acid transport system substrate-binding protein
VAQELVANADVIAVVGHVTSGAMVSAAKVYDGNLAAIATSATTPDLTGISRWVFRVSSSDSINGQEIARFATALGRKRAAIIYENDSYGRGLAEAFRRGFPGEIVAVDPIAADPGDLEPYIAWYKRRAPDVVVGIGVETSGLALLREAHRQGLNAAFIGGDGWTGIITDTVAAEGAYVGTPFTVADPRAEVQRFVDAFQRRFGRLPDSDAALAYDATRLIVTAIRERGADRAAVRDYLATFSARAAFHGVTGEIRFRADGDRERSAYVMTRVRRGWLVPAREMGR